MLRAPAGRRVSYSLVYIALTPCPGALNLFNADPPMVTASTVVEAWSDQVGHRVGGDL